MTIPSHAPCRCVECALGTTGKRIVQVLELTACGYTTPEIARALVVSQATIKRDKTTAFKWLGARTAAQAVALAIQEGVIRVGHVEQEAV